MLDYFLKKVYLVFIFSGIGVGSLTRARIVSPCELALDLLQHKVEFSKLADWICLAHAGSGYDTSKVTGFGTNPYHNLQYGIFQVWRLEVIPVSGSECVQDRFGAAWIQAPKCFFGDDQQENNDCLLNCSQLIDEELDDDIDCAELVYRRGKDSFKQWGPMFSQHCGNSTANRKLLKGCDVLNGEPPKVTTKEANVTFTVKNVFGKDIRCEAKGTPPISANWMKNQKNLNPSDPEYIVETGFDPENNLTTSVLKFNYNASTENVDLFKCQTENLYVRDAKEILVTVRNDDDGSRSSGSDLVILIAASITAIMVLVIGSTVYYTCLKENTGLSRAEINAFENGALTTGNILEVEYIHESLAAQPYDRKFEIDKNDLMIDRTKILGEGHYGIVYKGTYRGQRVAVKTIKPGAGKMYLEALLVELKVLSYVSGRGNVVELIGACTKELNKGQVYLVIEYYPLGSLFGFLERYRKEWGYTIGKDAVRKFEHYDQFPEMETDPISELQMTSWSLQIAVGMEYLASKKVIHGDLAARNILMLDPQNIKITDFGLSRKLYERTFRKYNQGQTMVTYRIPPPLHLNNNDLKTGPYWFQKQGVPWQWMAPEILRERKFSTASDAWSFGVTLWELFSLGQVPYPGLSCSMDFIRGLEQGLRLTKPDFATDSMHSIMVECWNNNPTSRPNFTVIRQVILQELKQLYQSEYIDSDELHLIAGLDL